MAVAFRAAGTAQSGTGAVTPGLPTGHAADDILVLVIQCGASDTPSPPAGWTQITGHADSGSTFKLFAYWKRDSGSESAPSCADAGNHQIAQIYAFSGCTTSGDPSADAQHWDKLADTTFRSGLGAATVVYTQDGVLAVVIGGHSNDSATGNQFSSWLNPSSIFDGALTEATGSDVSTSSGTGGGFALAYANMTTHGTIASNEPISTIANSLATIGITFVLKPPAAASTVKPFTLLGVG